ncbi:MAG: YqhA family protein [Olsenella sp.]|nr:YqhA family protein [Olsenella sp.]
MNSDSNSSAAEKKDFLITRQVTGRTRWIASVPALGLLIASVVLAVGTLAAVCMSSVIFAIGGIDLHGLSIEFVEDADMFLLAVALFLLSIGLVNLFISDDIPLPKWLEFRDFDDLKERFASVINVMIGVYFLGYVLKGAQGLEALWTGLGCAAIIVALSIFMGTVFKSGD